MCSFGLICRIFVGVQFRRKGIILHEIFQKLFLQEIPGKNIFFLRKNTRLVSIFSKIFYEVCMQQCISRQIILQNKPNISQEFILFLLLYLSEIEFEIEGTFRMHYFAQNISQNCEISKPIFAKIKKIVRKIS